MEHKDASVTKSMSSPEGPDQTATMNEQSLKPPPLSRQHDGADRNKPDGALPGPNGEATDYLSAGSASLNGLTTPSTPGLSRSNSSSDFSANFEAFGQDSGFPPVDRLTMFDVLENLALPQRLEKMQTALRGQGDKVRAQRQKLTKRALSSKDTLVEEWRKRVPLGPEEQLEKYRKQMRTSIDRLGKRYNDAKTVTVKEKISFVTAVLNIFISGYLIGAWPEYFHLWYTAQLAYFMPIRWYTYHKIGFHYFLADLCYFVNLLLTLSIWFFPQSKRLFISTYCLALGNNAVAIVMWRNSLVFHSLDKVTSLFIHIMPCATLHCLVHLISKEMQLERFPAIHTIKYSTPDAPEHYTLSAMVVWATLPYAIWQLSYHFLITVRRRSKIAAGRPTSFSWLRKSYKDNFLGKFVLSFPDSLQEYVFMGIQYGYALLTMLPCPLWFWSRWASAAYLMVVFTWASWNGATFYIDVFGRRMEKELEQLKKEVARMSKSPDMKGEDDTSTFVSPVGSPAGPTGMEGATPTFSGLDGNVDAKSSALDLGPAAQEAAQKRSKSSDQMPAPDGNISNLNQDADQPGIEMKNVRFDPQVDSNGTNSMKEDSVVDVKKDD